MSDQALPKLDDVDLKLLAHVFYANAQTVQMGMPAGTPYLYSGRSWRRVRALCDAGLLKLHTIVKLSPPIESLVPVTITQAGIDAYNATVAQSAGSEA